MSVVRFALVVFLVCALGIVLVFTMQPAPTKNNQENTSHATTTQKVKMQWGVYVEGGADARAAFERAVESPVDMQAVFVGWGSRGAFPHDVAHPLKESGKTLVLFWEPSNGNSDVVEQPAYNYDSIVSGSWDAYIKTFAREAATYGAPVLLVPFAEMNSDWYPWSGTTNGNTPEKAIAAWRHVHDLFVDADNVAFGWAPNAQSIPNTPQNALTAYYPGDGYVAYVGVDGFNFNDGTWKSFDELFGEALIQLAQYHKPIYIFSTASAPGEKKAEWITDAFTVGVYKYPGIVGWLYFNANKEKEWRVTEEGDSLAAFKAAIE